MKNGKKTKISPKKDFGCLLCKHTDKTSYEKSWLLGEKSLTNIANELGCSVPLVHRHMHNHISGNSNVLNNELSDSTIEVLSELQKLYNKCDSFLADAEKSDGWQDKKAFISEARQILRVIAEVQGKIQSINIQMNILNNPQISAIINTILVALEPYPEAKLACAKALDTGEK